MSEFVLTGNTPVTSPYFLAAFVALELKQVDYELQLLNLEHGEHRTESYLAMSLTGKIPLLSHKQGQSVFHLAESSAICEYLEELYPPPEHVSLFPGTIAERARARLVSALIRSDFMPLRSERSTETILQHVAAKPLSSEAEAAAKRLIAIATRLLDGRPFLASSFGVADVDLATMLMRLVHNHDPVPESLREYAHRVWSHASVSKWLKLTNYQPR